MKEVGRKPQSGGEKGKTIKRTGVQRSTTNNFPVYGKNTEKREKLGEKRAA